MDYVDAPGTLNAPDDAGRERLDHLCGAMPELQCLPQPNDRHRSRPNLSGLSYSCDTAGETAEGREGGRVASPASFAANICRALRLNGRFAGPINLVLTPLRSQTATCPGDECGRTAMFPKNFAIYCPVCLKHVMKEDRPPPPMSCWQRYTGRHGEKLAVIELESPLQYVPLPSVFRT